MPRAKEFIKLLREKVSDETARHCVFTAEFMSSFAEAAGIEHDQAITAGLLHDLAKDRDDNALLAAAQTYGIAVTEAQRCKPGLVHGAVGAEECRRTLGITDEAVLEAITWHTTGRPGLGKVGQALFLADFAEPSRVIPAAAEAREILRQEGFRSALLFVARSKAGHVRGQPCADPLTAAFEAWLETVP